MKWPFTFYPKVLKGNTLGESKFFFIWILSELKENTAVYQHELQHVKQWFFVTLAAVTAWITLCFNIPELQQYANLAVLLVFLDQMLYSWFTPYRSWAETQAYKTQIKYGYSPSACAESLARDYNLGITKEEALIKLKS